MWFFIWFLLSLFVLGVFGWSLLILEAQKKAWRSYAKKYGMEYRTGRFMDSPALAGRIDKRRVFIYTNAKQTADLRGQRFVTVIEIEMGHGIPAGGGLFATADMAPLADQFNFSDTFVPMAGAKNDWNSAYLVRCRDTKAVEAYLTPARQKILHTIFSMKNAAALFVFDEHEAVLRVETADPLRDPERLEKIVTQFLSAIQKLAPGKTDKEAQPAAIDADLTENQPNP